jgi:hypothetical protein
MCENWIFETYEVEISRLIQKIVLNINLEKQNTSVSGGGGGL